LALEDSAAYDPGAIGSGTLFLTAGIDWFIQRRLSAPSDHSGYCGAMGRLAGWTWSADPVT